MYGWRGNRLYLPFQCIRPSGAVIKPLITPIQVLCLGVVLMSLIRNHYSDRLSDPLIPGKSLHNPEMEYSRHILITHGI